MPVFCAHSKTLTVLVASRPYSYYLQNQHILDIFDVWLYSTAFPFLFLIIITVTTAVTAARLRNVQAKRKRSLDASSTAAATTSGTATTTQVPKSGHSKRELAVTKMLIGTSILFIICLLPMLAVQVATFIVPDLSYEGHYYNLCSVLWNVISIFRCINSSTNFFVYYKMGSKFRETLGAVLFCCRRGRVHPSDNKQHTSVESQ
ncbi:hypothetical protein BaRGS_00020342 [Batillaria attramentaria]|uniref:G-protein coupled receptors family 1 profile domain-containing protein n=1 Tax=Batillaria attramentaria TaxID=370345 RepID=A0ABD0KN95_9CAEN